MYLDPLIWRGVLRPIQAQLELGPIVGWLDALSLARRHADLARSLESSLCGMGPQRRRFPTDTANMCTHSWLLLTFAALPSVRYSPVSWKPCAKAAQDAPVSEIE